MTTNRYAQLQGYDKEQVNQCPAHGMGGRHPDRATLDRLAGHDDPGMFGRMFPRLPPLDVPEAGLAELAQAMRDQDPADASLDNDAIPGGFTYLGQFVDHDITLDLTSLSDKKRDPLGLTNFRTPSLDLDNVYGLGPDGSPHLYARDPAEPHIHGPKLLIGRNITVDFGGVTGEFRNDLPRSPEGFALIGDPRNDENLLVAQTHLAFLKFHNAVCDKLASEGVPADEIFPKARRLVTWHYQYMVLHDWVERLCGEGTVARILHDGRQYYRFKTRPYMPVEFSVAAYRLGHSMVRQRYSHNKVFADTDFDLLFGSLLVVLTLGLGLWPYPLIEMMEPSVVDLVDHITTTKPTTITSTTSRKRRLKRWRRRVSAAINHRLFAWLARPDACVEVAKKRPYHYRNIVVF